MSDTEEEGGYDWPQTAGTQANDAGQHSAEPTPQNMTPANGESVGLGSTAVGSSTNETPLSGEASHPSDSEGTAETEPELLLEAPHESTTTGGDDVNKFDIKKATTVGWAVKEGTNVDKIADNVAKNMNRIKEIDEGKNLFDNNSNLGMIDGAQRRYFYDDIYADRTDIRQAQNKIKDLQERLDRAVERRNAYKDGRDESELENNAMYQSLVNDIAWYEREIAERQKAVDEYIPEVFAKERSRRLQDVDDEMEGFDKFLNKKQAPFEELYDVNPALFDDMPTSEFLKHVKDLEALLDNHSWFKQEKSIFKSISEELDQILEKAASEDSDVNVSLDWFDMDKLSLVLSQNFDRFGGLDKTYDETLNKFNQEASETFLDTTPRQRIEAWKNLLKDFENKTQERAMAAEAKVSEFKARFAPQQSAPESQQVA